MPSSMATWQIDWPDVSTSLTASARNEVLQWVCFLPGVDSSARTPPRCQVSTKAG
jgi:hypothetical protein